MSLTKQDVHKIAHLARLAISDADVPDYAKNLSDILSFVEQMNTVDTTGVTPMAHPLNASQRLRPDEVTETDQREHFQSVAPLTESGLYLVGCTSGQSEAHTENRLTSRSMFAGEEFHVGSSGFS